MGKSKQSAPTDSTVRQTNLPEYADPYFRRLLQGAEEASMPFDPVTGESMYTPYQGERIAPSSMYGDIQGSRAMTRGIAQTGIAGMPAAMQAVGTASGIQQEGADIARSGIGATGEGIGRLRSAGDYGTGQFSEAGFSQYGFQQPDMFTGESVQQYMSPYMQNVVDVQKQQARLDFDRSQAGRDAAAVQAGAFGGSRQAVQQALAEEALGRQMGDIQATGQQQAFEQASRMFGEDRAAQMAVEQQRAAELGRVQSGQASELARVQQAREQSQQFGAGQRLAAEQAALGAAGQLGSMAQGLGGLGMNVGQLGQTLAGLGERQRAADIQGAQLLETVGRDIRAEDQARADLAYEDFVRQRDYPMEQYERMAGILRGVPVTPDVEQQRFASYNPVQQALGAGISALGLYKGLSA